MLKKERKNRYNCYKNNFHMIFLKDSDLDEIRDVNVMNCYNKIVNFCKLS